MNITFKTKIKEVEYYGEAEPRRYFKVPAVERRHCDMSAFRTSRRFGGFANSDLFLGMVRGELRKRKLTGEVFLSSLPEGVTVDQSGFLAVITIAIPDS